MTQEPDWVPPGIDMSVPSAARVYDYLLGGGHNFEADRLAAKQVEQVQPKARGTARLSRAFLRRVVRFMADQGIRQFLDIGSGVPTVGNVHEIAQRVDPECRVVYVDRDPVAVAHSEMILAGNDHATVINADARDPDLILSHPSVRRQLNLDEPIGLLFLMVLHWIPDEADLTALLTRFRSVVAGGSYLAISHGTEDLQRERVQGMTKVLRDTKSADQVTARTHDEVLAMFGDFELVEPGLVGCGTWRPDGPGDIVEDPELNQIIYAGVARKP